MAAFDFSESFTSLIKFFTCSICNKLYENPVDLNTCSDVFCLECINNIENCPTCNSSIIPSLIKTKESTRVNVDKIKKLQKLYEASETKYRIENLPLNLLDVTKGGINLTENGVNSINGSLSSAETDTITQFSNLNNDKSFVCHEIGMNEICVVTAPSRRNHKGETPLHVACHKRDIIKVTALVNSGIDINIKDFGNWTPLHDAVHKNAYDCVEKLLNSGALVNAPGENYITPLYQAVDLNYPILCQLLISYGATINCEDYFGKNILDFSSEATKEILNKTVAKDTTSKEKFFVNPISNVLYRGSDEQILKQLASLGLTVHRKQTKQDNLHLVIVDNEEKFTYSTILLMAIVNSVMVIQNKDLQTFVTVGHPIQPKLIPAEIQTSLTKSIHNNLSRNPQFFDGMNFYVVIKDKYITMGDVKILKEDLVKLLTMGGGKILARAPAERTVDKIFLYPFHLRDCQTLKSCSTYIIYDKNKRPDLLYNLAELKHVSAQWILQCIWNYKFII